MVRLPELLVGQDVRPCRALFLLPTPAHQRLANRGRGEWVDDVLARTENPERAWEQWMELDEEFARLLSRSAGDQNYGVLWNDGCKSPEEFALLAERHFRL